MLQAVATDMLQTATKQSTIAFTKAAVVRLYAVSNCLQGILSDVCHPITF